MATGYTQDQLDQLERDMVAQTPPLPTPADKKVAKRVIAMRAAGTELGAVFNFGFKGGWTLVFYLNCVVAKELAGAINQANLAYGWAKRGLEPADAEHLDWPTPEDLGSAFTVTSLSTDSTRGGTLVNFYISQRGEGDATMIFYFPVRAALEVLTTVAGVAKTAGWWNPADFELRAKRTVN